MKKLLTACLLLVMVGCGNQPPKTIKGEEVDSFKEACSPSGELYDTRSCEDYP